MNRTFKTIWNEARRCFIVANETQKSHGKPSKSAVALAVVATALFSTVASAAYVEKGELGNTVSWESSEYKGDWGLSSINASTAYAMGVTGSSVKIGVVDSGTALHHSEMSGDRWHNVTTTGKYSSTGTRYPNGNGPTTNAKFPNGNGHHDNFVAGQDFNISGEYEHGVSDQHGTHVSGTIGANRDGVGMHGVAWGSQMYVASTGGYDSMTYGPNQDYGYFKAAYEGLLKQGVRIINQSWGSNRNHGYPGATGNNTKPGGTIDWSTTMPTLADCEQAWYHFDQIGHKTFVDAASELALKNDVIFVWTNGNGSNKSPYTRALLPYFNPEIEGQWLAVAMSNYPKPEGEKDNPAYNHIAGWSGHAGFAKWWTITAPGAEVNSSIVDLETGKTTDKDGNPLYGYKSGTSMAAPYASGALALVMDRYGYMTANQARDVLLTTATTEQDGDVMSDKPNEKEGWGYVNMNTAMFGPGQFLGKFDVTMNGVDDTWSNNISDTALDQRKIDDDKEAAEWKTRKADVEKMLATGKTLDGTKNLKAAEIADLKSELKYKTAREQARADRIYEGSLVKNGSGKLTLAGSNTYRGGTTVAGGTLEGLTQSFGTGDVLVKDGGTLSVVSEVSYLKPTENKGFEEVTVSQNADRLVNAKIEQGGILSVGDGVTLGKVAFEKGSQITATASNEELVKLYKDDAKATVHVEATGTFTNEANATFGSNLAFFESTGKIEGGKITADLKRGESMASVATSANGAALGVAIEAKPDSKLFAEFVGSTKDQALATYASLGNDLHMTVNNMSIVNSVAMNRAIKDQANAFGKARTAELENGIEVWATGVGHFGSVDAGGASVDMDSDYYNGLFGAEVAYGDNNKVGVFFGAGKSENDASLDGNVDSKDIHVGIYGENVWDALGVTYGLAYTTQDRDSSRTLLVKNQLGANSVNYDAEVMQVFGEVSYEGFNSDVFTVEPYAGLSYMKISADSFTEKVGAHEFKTQLDDQKVGTVNVGVRGVMPFSVASLNMAVKGDVGYMQFFGDKESTAKMTLGDAGTANLKGEELSGMGAVGLGVDAAIGKNTTIGVSYTGAFGSDITSHGVGATLRVKF